MNAAEALVLCRYVRAVCPQQAIDDYTPDAWADLLTGIRFVDAKDAVRKITSRQPFVAPAEIITEVRRIRNERIIHHPQPIPPPDLNPVESASWLREARRRIGDGELLPDVTRGELIERDIPALLAGATPTQEANS